MKRGTATSGFRNVNPSKISARTTQGKTPKRRTLTSCQSKQQSDATGFGRLADMFCSFEPIADRLFTCVYPDLPSHNRVYKRHHFKVN